MIGRRRLQHWSLARRQLVLIGGASTLLAILLGIGGSWYINGVAERTSDRLLAGSIKSLTDALGEEAGAVTLEIPASAFGMLEDAARDNVYYAVRQGGRTLSGYADFPRASSRPTSPDDVAFRYDRYLGQKIRVATAMRILPRMQDPVIVEVAETMGERRALAARMLLGLIALELILVAFAVLLIWPAIRWGLHPVHDLRARMQERRSDRIDLTPLSLEGVPPELTGLVLGFNTLLQRLAQSVDGMRRFTGDAAHQMRTPLAILRTHVEVLKQRVGSDPSVDDIDLAAQRLQRLLTQLLTMARLDDRSAAGPSGAVADAALAAQTVCLRAAPEAIARDVSIEFSLNASFPVSLEELLLEELIANAVDNAVRYNNPGGTVLVTVERNGSNGVIEIADDGPGVPEDLRPKVFDRFYRLERDQSRPGSGLGLPIARTLAEIGGGAVELTSGVNGQGLKVRFVFNPI